MSASPRVVLVDNFDSFTFNLVDEFSRRDCEVEVWRNSIPASRLMEIALRPPRASLVVLSPGPGRPAEAGCCIDLIRLAAGRLAFLGVCLGHQAIIEAFGGQVQAAPVILHGRSSQVVHAGDPIFDGVPSPFVAGRYHSLAGAPGPEAIEAIAWSGPVVMAVRHRGHPVIGLQFHPESILTPHGGRIVENVLREALMHEGAAR
jgi:anthranilate synthase component 2